MSDDRIAKLENDLKGAQVVLAALVKQAGGKVTLSDELLVQADPDKLVTVREVDGFVVALADVAAPRSTEGMAS